MRSGSLSAERREARAGPVMRGMEGLAAGDFDQDGEEVAAFDRLGQALGEKSGTFVRQGLVKVEQDARDADSSRGRTAFARRARRCPRRDP